MKFIIGFVPQGTIVYKYIFNIVGVKKCISLFGGYSWPDLLCGIKGGREDVFRRGKYIVNKCGVCTFVAKCSPRPAVL